MELKVTTVENAIVVTIQGDLDGATTPLAQEKVLSLGAPGARLALDLSGVGYMSSAGLRMLLSTYRAIVSAGGKLVLVGLSEELADTMSMTGFLDFFVTSPSLDEGLKALAG
jgi:anti-sigma B factor antagonist